jgi:predicted enzyme related to lactoylglutathione lyase
MNLLVNIDVDDLHRAIKFYTSAFDLTVARRFGLDGAELLGGSAPIYLLLKAAGSQASFASGQVRNYERHWTPVHLDIVVKDVEASVERALSAGARLENEIRSSNWGKLALMADPFGHGFCLIQFVGKGYDEIATPPP